MITKVEVFRTSDGVAHDTEKAALEHAVDLLLMKWITHDSTRAKVLVMLCRSPEGPNFAELLAKLHLPAAPEPCKLEALHKRGIDELRGTLAAPTVQANNIAAAPVKDAAKAPRGENGPLTIDYDDYGA